MRYSDGRANNILGNSTLFLFFICAFAFVTLWPELTKDKHLFSRYFEHFQRPLEFNTSKCQNLREDIRKIHFLSMVWEAELFDRWRRLEIVCVWRQNHSEAQTFRLMLQRCCNAPSLLFVTQSNTPISSTVHYEQESVKNVPIENSIYYMLPKSMPYQRQQLARCAVVGNGGILHNSRCGSEIDAMEFVFRCNLPPVSAEFAKDVGSKTDIVTINPSIIIDRYDSLMQRHGPFLARIRSYGNASLLLPAFFGGRSMELALRARYVLDEAGSSRPLYFFHPIYLAHVGAFWRRHGVQERRSSSGLLVVSAALELCREVHLYGFWPFSQDVDGAHLSHHYYDDQRPRPGIHVMPIENFHFLQLHSKGILRVHTQRCSN